jgi:hypothetical protein
MFLNKRMAGIVVAVIAMAAAVQSASAVITLNGSGEVLDGWNVTPFSNTNAPATASLPGGITAIYQNNYSPINFGGSIGNHPSPGGSGGETYDLEEMYIRQTTANANIVQMLLVGSSGYTAGSFHLGDVLLDLGNNGSYDAAIVSQTFNSGLTAGGLYAGPGLTFKDLQNLSGSYLGNGTVETAIGNKWAVNAGTLKDTIAIDQTTFSYGASVLGNGQYQNENNTYLTLFSFDISKLGVTLPTTVGFQLDWGCGNDMINGSFTVNPPVGGPGPGSVPEPLTGSLALMSLGGVALAAFRRRK